MTQFKKVRLLALTIVFGAGLALANSAHAEKTGNGGGSWVCREAGGQIRWSQVVDLFEAQEELSLTLAPHSGTMDEVVEQVKGRLFRVAPELIASLTPFFDKVNNLHAKPGRILLTDNTLRVIDDSLYHMIPGPKKCAGGTIAYEQTVNYTNNGLILVQAEVFASLSIEAQAALVFHEAFYAYLRAYFSAQDSVLARWLVGVTFSTSTDGELRESIEKARIFRPCDAQEMAKAPVGTVCVVLDRNRNIISRWQIEFSTHPYRRYYHDLTSDLSVILLTREGLVHDEAAKICRPDTQDWRLPTTDDFMDLVDDGFWYAVAHTQGTLLWSSTRGEASENAATYFAHDTSHSGGFDADYGPLQGNPKNKKGAYAERLSHGVLCVVGNGKMRKEKRDIKDYNIWQPFHLRKFSVRGTTA